MKQIHAKKENNTYRLTGWKKIEFYPKKNYFSCTRNKEINKTWLHGIYAKKFLFDCDSNKLSISWLKRMFFLQHTSELLEINLINAI